MVIDRHSLLCNMSAIRIYLFWTCLIATSFLNIFKTWNMTTVLEACLGWLEPESTHTEPEMLQSMVGWSIVPPITY
jgi:hypothetical protein